MQHDQSEEPDEEDEDKSGSNRTEEQKEVARDNE